MKSKMWKRAAVILLSIILSLEMSGWMEPLEVSAAEDKPTYRLRITLKGYEGEGMPEIGLPSAELTDLSGDLHETVGSEEISISWDGNFLYYAFEFESGKWNRIQISLDYGNGDKCVLGSTFSSAPIKENCYPQLPLIRWTFMDGSDVYYEKYAAGGTMVHKPDDPEKEGHEFLGWSKDGSESEIVDYDQFADSWAQIYFWRATPVTLYAVWRHAWEWQSDNDCHWGMCYCGDLTATEEHTWDGGRVTKEPTNMETGEKTYTCTICSRVRIEAIPVKDALTDNGNDNISDNNDPDSSSDADDSGNTDNNVNADEVSIDVEKVNISASTNRNNEPETGYTSRVEIYATAAMIAGLLYLLLSFAEIKGLTEAKKKELISFIISWANEGRKYRRYVALAAIFFVLVYYHSIGKSIMAEECLTY